MKKFMLLFLFLFPIIAMAQDQQPAFGIKFSGYVKNDFFFDTHKTVSLREGEFYLYPENAKYDKDNVDINAHTSFNILAIQSRLRGDIFGPDAFGAKTSGVIEGEFFGTQEGNSNGFRLRHAYCKLSWQTTDVIIGQTWHGMFVEGCFPEIMAINTGSPFQPFSRNPQIKIIQKLKDVKFLLSVMTQRDFTSWGGSDALRNATLPELNLRIQYQHFNADNSHEIFFGAGADYKILVPRLVTDSNYSTNTSMNNYSFMAFFKLRSRYITLKLEGIYGQNMYDQVMLGGYAYKYTTDSAIIARGDFEYTPLNTVSSWIDIATNGTKIQFGVFGGYTKNLGSYSNILNWKSESCYFARGKNIDYVYRISPRIVFISGKVKMGIEGDYTVAGYGSTVNSLGEVQNIKPISNVRLMYSLFYYF
ncbi:MAG: hypothetical protein WCQ95_05250 [Bacteroidota bacterium]